MKDAIIDGRDITVVLLNYRKDGKTFWNQIQLAHLKDQSGKTFLIVGIQTKVSSYVYSIYHCNLYYVNEPR